MSKSLILTLLIPFTFLGCDWGNPYAEKKQIQEVDLNFINLVIGLDMTERVSNPSQVKEDLTALNFLIDRFEERQKQKGYRSLDKISIDIISDRTDDLPKENLEVVMTAKGGRRKFEEEISTFREALRKLYEHYSSKPSKSKDLYSIFRDYIPSILIASDKNNQVTYSNKLILVSDGYFSVSNQLPVSRGITPSKINSLSENPDWRGEYNNLDRKIEPIRDVSFGNLQVMVLGIGDDVASGISDEFLILRRFWIDWLDKMGVENTVVRQGTIRDQNSMILEDFLTTLHFIDKYSFPFEQNGNQYFLTYLKENEIVKDNQGVYFKISLTNSSYFQTLGFKNGKYTISTIEVYRDAFIEFAESVLKKINETDTSHKGYKIFIKGTADALGASTFQSTQREPYIYEEICFLPKDKASNRFKGPLQCTSVPINFTNKELPNLRGRFACDIFSIYLNQYETPIQLEGNVTYDISEDDRNVVMYLYLPSDLFLN